MSQFYNRSYFLKLQTLEGTVHTINELRITFEITMSNISFPNLAKIEIYNPSLNTIANITQITLSGGYKDNVCLLFNGEIRNIFIVKLGVDRIVTIYAGDGERAWKTSTFNKTFSSSVPAFYVINEVAKSFGLGVKIQGISNIANRELGQTFSGSSKDVMNALALEYDFDWFIQEGNIIVIPKNAALISNDIAVLAANTGMIGSATLTEIGVDVKSLLNPELHPGKMFKVQSTTSLIAIGNLFFRNVKRSVGEGVYKIIETLHIGDTHDGEWVTEVKGLLL